MRYSNNLSKGLPDCSTRVEIVGRFAVTGPSEVNEARLTTSAGLVGFKSVIELLLSHSGIVASDLDEPGAPTTATTTSRRLSGTRLYLHKDTNSDTSRLAQPVKAAEVIIRASNRQAAMIATRHHCTPLREMSR